MQRRFLQLDRIWCQNTLTRVTVALTAAVIIAIPAAYAEEDLRAAAQNPIGNLISVPFQNNLNFGLGDTDNIQNVLNIQPVYPIHLDDTWNLITRPILPVIYQEPFFAGEELDEVVELLGDDYSRNLFGLGDLTWENFFSPREPTELAPGVGMVWGLGPVLQLPTQTNDLLGTGKWSAGPAFVVFVEAKPLSMTGGFLIFNVWSFAGDDDRDNVNAMTLQPFLNYNMPEGWYLTSSPLITANWEADKDERWVVPHWRGHRPPLRDRASADQCQHRRLLQHRDA